MNSIVSQTSSLIRTKRLVSKSWQAYASFGGASTLNDTEVQVDVGGITYLGRPETSNGVPNLFSLYVSAMCRRALV